MTVKAAETAIAATSQTDTFTTFFLLFLTPGFLVPAFLDIAFLVRAFFAAGVFWTVEGLLFFVIAIDSSAKIIKFVGGNFG